MTACKYCQVALEDLVLPSGELSRRSVCDACRQDSPKRQAENAKATKRERFSRQVVACRHCHCPLVLMRLPNGKQEQRRVCARCHDAKLLELTEKQKKRQAQIKAWKEANKERIKILERAWKTAHKDQVSDQRRKLLIEDGGLVQQAASAFHQRQVRKPRRSANDI